MPCAKARLHYTNVGFAVSSGRESMPKDASKNVDRYKVRGGHLNEHEFETQKAAEKKEKATPKQKVSKTTPPKSPKH